MFLKTYGVKQEFVGGRRRQGCCGSGPHTSRECLLLIGGHCSTSCFLCDVAPKYIWTSQGGRMDPPRNDSGSCPWSQWLKDWLVVHGEGRDEREGPLLTFWVRHGLKRSYRNFIVHPFRATSFLLLIGKLKVGSCFLELGQPEVSEWSFHSINTGAIILLMNRILYER